MTSDKRRVPWSCIVVLALSWAATVRGSSSDVKLRGPPSKQAKLQHDGSQGSALIQSHEASSLEGQTEVGLMKRVESRLRPWLHHFSIAAVLTTIALQLSPMPSSLEIRRDKDVKRYDGYPYFSVLAGATQWCTYGSYASFESRDLNFLTMVAANAPGVFFGVFYITNFFNFAPSEDARSYALQRYLMIGAGILLAEAACCIVLREGAVFWLGLLGAVGSAQIALSPFKTLPEVLRTRSTRSWPLDLCFWNLVQSWFTGGFGLANNDMWVFVPNLIGVIAAVIQLGLIAAFWESPFGARGMPVKLKATTAII